MEKIENIFRDLHLPMGGNPLLGSVEVTITMSLDGIHNIQKYLDHTINTNGFFPVVGASLTEVCRELTVQTIYGTIKFISNGN